MTGMEILGIWIAAGLTLAIYSFLYKDNPAYKMAEHIYVGVSAGYYLCIYFFNVIKPNVWKELTENHNFIVLIPAFLGLLMFSRFIEKFSWVSRISIAFVIGAGAGISVPNSIQGYFIRHTSATILPVISNQPYDWATFLMLVNSILILMGVAFVLMYFFFSIEHGKGLKVVSRLGVIYLMIFFGAQFGYTVMGRVSLVIGRMRFLILDWWPLILDIFR